MKSIFTLIGLTLVVAAAAGWYLDWYHIHSTSTSSGQKVITLDVNSDQVREDLKHAKEKVENIWNGTTQTTPVSTPNGSLPPPPPMGTNPPGTSTNNNNNFFQITPTKEGGVSLDIKPPPLPFFPPQK